MSNQKQLFLQQQKLFNLWKQKQVEQEYRQWFLNVIDNLNEQEAIRQIKLEHKKLFQNQSYFHLIDQAKREREKIMESLVKYLQNQNNMQYATETFKSLRNINYKLCELFIKIKEYSQSKGAVGGYLSLIEYIKQMDQQNKLITNSYLAKYINFGKNFDPFFLIPYKNYMKLKKINPSSCQKASKIIYLSPSTLYQYITIKNKLVQAICQTDDFNKSNISQQFLNPNNFQQGSLNSPRCLKNRLDKIHKNRFSTLPVQNYSQIQSPYQSLSPIDERFKKTTRTIQKNSLPIIPNKKGQHNSTLVKQSSGSDQEQIPKYQKKIQRKTRNKFYSKMQSLPKIWEYKEKTNKISGQQAFQNKMKNKFFNQPGNYNKSQRKIIKLSPLQKSRQDNSPSLKKYLPLIPSTHLQKSMTSEKDEETIRISEIQKKQTGPRKKRQRSQQKIYQYKPKQMEVNQIRQSQLNILEDSEKSDLDLNSLIDKISGELDENNFSSNQINQSDLSSQNQSKYKGNKRQIMQNHNHNKSSNSFRSKFLSSDEQKRKNKNKKNQIKPEELEQLSFKPFQDQQSIPVQQQDQSKNIKNQKMSQSHKFENKNGGQKLKKQISNENSENQSQFPNKRKRKISEKQKLKQKDKQKDRLNDNKKSSIKQRQQKKDKKQEEESIQKDSYQIAKDSSQGKKKLSQIRNNKHLQEAYSQEYKFDENQRLKNNQIKPEEKQSQKVIKEKNQDYTQSEESNSQTDQINYEISQRVHKNSPRNSQKNVFKINLQRKYSNDKQNNQDDNEKDEEKSEQKHNNNKNNINKYIDNSDDITKNNDKKMKNQQIQHKLKKQKKNDTNEGDNIISYVEEKDNTPKQKIKQKKENNKNNQQNKAKTGNSSQIQNKKRQQNQNILKPQNLGSENNLSEPNKKNYHKDFRKNKFTPIIDADRQNQMNQVKAQNKIIEQQKNNEIIQKKQQIKDESDQQKDKQNQQQNNLHNQDLDQEKKIEQQDTQKLNAKKKQSNETQSIKNQNQKQSNSKQPIKATQKRKIQIKATSMTVTQFFKFLQTSQIKQNFKNIFEQSSWKEVISNRNCFLSLFSQQSAQQTTLLSFGVSSPNLSEYSYQILYWATLQGKVNAKAEVFLFKKYITYLQKYAKINFLSLPHYIQNPQYFIEFGFDINKSTRKYERKSLIKAKDIDQRQLFIIQFSNICMQSPHASNIFYSEELESFTKKNYCTEKTILLCQRTQIVKLSPNFIFEKDLHDVNEANKALEKAGLDIYEIHKDSSTPKCSLCYLKLNLRLQNYFFISKGYFVCQGVKYVSQDSKKSIIKLESVDKNYSLYFDKNFEDITEFTKFCIKIQKQKQISKMHTYFGFKMFSKQMYGATKFSQKRKSQGYGNWFLSFIWQDQLKGVLQKQLPAQQYLFGPQNYYISLFYQQKMLYSIEIDLNDFLF